MFDTILARLEALFHRQTGHDEQLGAILSKLDRMSATAEAILDAIQAANVGEQQVLTAVQDLAARVTAQGGVLTPDQADQALAAIRQLPVTAQAIVDQLTAILPAA